MNEKTISAIRDLALTFENTDLQIAYELMKIAHQERPHGPFIKRKYLSYKRLLQYPPQNHKLLSLLKSGDIAIVPIGFRCYTKFIIKNRLGFSQPSLPFDSGFFSPHAVTSVFYHPKISLAYTDNRTHTVCKKYENHIEKEKGKGIRFELSSYPEIDSLAKSKDFPRINRYLDSTFGYYTLDKNHKYILAHYNWHPFADDTKSKGIKNPKDNIPLINDMLNKRIERMLELCHTAKYIFFIYQNNNGNYIKIENEFYDLEDYSELETCLDSKYNFKYSILNAKDICAKEMLDLFEKNKS